MTNTSVISDICQSNHIRIILFIAYDFNCLHAVRRWFKRFEMHFSSSFTSKYKYTTGSHSCTLESIKGIFNFTLVNK